MTGRLVSAGDYLVIYKQRVSGNATPAVKECDTVKVYPGYSLLIAQGKPTFEVKKGALIATISKKDFARLGDYAAEYPSLRGLFEEVRLRWESEINELARKKVLAEQAFVQSLSNGDKIQTLDGLEFHGLIKASGQHSLAITTSEGVTSVGIAQLSTPDLKKWAGGGRALDGRFWYERTLAVIKAREAGIDVSEESKEVEAHFPESSRYLSEMDRARAARRAAMLEAVSGSTRTIETRGSRISTQEDIDELIRMSKLGYTPVLDAATGQVFYSAPVDREQQLRDAMGMESTPDK